MAEETYYTAPLSVPHLVWFLLVHKRFYGLWRAVKLLVRGHIGSVRTAPLFRSRAHATHANHATPCQVARVQVGWIRICLDASLFGSHLHLRLHYWGTSNWVRLTFSRVASVLLRRNVDSLPRMEAAAQVCDHHDGRRSHS